MLPTYFLSSLRLRDRLYNLDTPLILGAYIYLLGVKDLVSLSDGLAGYTLPLHDTLAVQKRPAVSTEAMNCALDGECRLARAFCVRFLPPLPQTPPTFSADHTRRVPSRPPPIGTRHRGARRITTRFVWARRSAHHHVTSLNNFFFPSLFFSSFVSPCTRYTLPSRHKTTNTRSNHDLH